MKMKEECLVIKAMNECQCENCKMWRKLREILRDMSVKHQIELERLKENKKWLK